MNENPWIDIAPGIRRRTITHGASMYQMMARLDAGSRMPEHKHPQEQIVHILEGRMKLIVSGVSHELKRGESFYLAATSRTASRPSRRRWFSIPSVRPGTIISRWIAAVTRH